MARLARNELVNSAGTSISPTSLLIKELFQTQSAEWFIRFEKDGTEYWDLFSVPVGGDVTTLTTGASAGHYLTFDYTAGTTVNDQPSAGNVVLH